MMPKTVQTMAWAYQQICAGEDPWTALGNFTNAWYDYAKDIRAALVSEPLVKSEQDSEHHRHWAAFCAASVEFLCDRYTFCAEEGSTLCSSLSFACGPVAVALGQYISLKAKGGKKKTESSPSGKMPEKQTTKELSMYRLRQMDVDDKVGEQVSMTMLEGVYPKDVIERCVLVAAIPFSAQTAEALFLPPLQQGDRAGKSFRRYDHA